MSDGRCSSYRQEWGQLQVWVEHAARWDWSGCTCSRCAEGCANCTVVPAKEAKELGLGIQEGTKASVTGVGGAQPSLGVTMFPSMVRAELGGKTANAIIDLKAQVMDGPSVEGKVIAGASQFITQFNGAALLVLDPTTKEWCGMMVMPHGARLALSINEAGMMVLGSDPSVCKGGQISVMPSVERICAELIKREATGSGRDMKEVLGAVVDLVKAASVPVRKKEAHTAAKLGNKVVHSEQGQAGNPWSCMQHETTDASDADSSDAGSTGGDDSDASFSTPGQSSQPLDMDPHDVLSATVEDEVTAFCSNLQQKFEQAMVGMKVQPVGAVTAAHESRAAQNLVHQVQQALERADTEVEHSLLGECRRLL